MNVKKIISIIDNPYKVWVIFIVWSLFITNLWLPRNWGFYGTDDWDLTYFTFETARKSIIDFHQFPIFNPYSTFGTDLAANPQAVHGGVFFIPVLLFGTFYGYKLSVLLALFIGLWGFCSLFRSINNDKLLTLLCAMLMVSSTYFAHHIFSAGHSNTLYFFLLPWILFCMIKYYKTLKFYYIILSVFLLSQLITGGAPIIFLFACVSVFFMVIIYYFISNEKRLIVLLLPFVLLLLSVGVSMWKLLPGINYWQQMPRLFEDNTGINLLVWLQALADFPTDTRTYHGWHEFALGFNLILFCFILYYFNTIHSYKVWLFVLLFLSWISIGNMPNYVNPWYVLNHYVPFFTSIRAPYRFGILVVMLLYISVLVINFSNKKLLYFFLAAVLFSQTLAYNAVSKKMINSPRLENINDTQQCEMPQSICLTADKRNTHFLALLENKQILNAYEPLITSNVYDTLKTFIIGAEISKFSPNIMYLTNCDSIITFNLRYSTFWQADNNAVIQNNGGKLQVFTSNKNITLKYINPHIREGVIISFLTLLIGSVICWLIHLKLKRNKVSLQAR